MHFFLLHWFCLLTVVVVVAETRIQHRRFHRQGQEPTYIPWAARSTNIPPTYIPWQPASTGVPPTYIPYEKPEGPETVPPTYIPWKEPSSTVKPETTTTPAPCPCFSSSSTVTPGDSEVPETHTKPCQEHPKSPDDLYVPFASPQLIANYIDTDKDRKDLIEPIGHLRAKRAYDPSKSPFKEETSLLRWRPNNLQPMGQIFNKYQPSSQ